MAHFYVKCVFFNREKYDFVKIREGNGGKVYTAGAERLI